MKTQRYLVQNPFPNDSLVFVLVYLHLSSLTHRKNFSFSPIKKKNNYPPPTITLITSACCRKVKPHCIAKTAGLVYYLTEP